MSPARAVASRRHRGCSAPAGLAALVPVIAALLLAACDSDDGVALGTLERDRIELVADAAEPIVEIAAAEGEALAAGALVLRQDDRLRRAELDRLRASLGQAQARLEELQAGPRAQEIAEAEQRLRGARGVAAEAKLQVQRLQPLVAREEASQSQLDAAAANLTAAEAEAGAAAERLALLREGTRAEQLRQAALAVDEIRAAIAAEEILLQRLAVTAPVAGTLDQLLYEVGERPPPGAVVAVLLAGQAPYARVHLPQGARAQLKVGDRLRVHVEGYPGAFEGRVSYVSADPDFSPYYALTERDRSRLMYPAEVTLPAAAAADLPVGLPVQVELPAAPP